MSLPTALFRLPSRFRHRMLPRIFTCQHSQNAIDSENVRAVSLGVDISVNWHGSVSDKWHVAKRCGILGIDPL